MLLALEGNGNREVRNCQTFSAEKQNKRKETTTAIKKVNKQKG